jgi:hypothetical protein
MINKILEENPEITKELQEFFFNMLITSAKKQELPTSFVDALVKQGVNKEILLGYLTATPRLICDFMDSKDVIILTTYNDNIGFSFTINGEPSKFSSDTRKDVETTSVVESIEFYKKIIEK